jgi:hypothetical protein
MRFRLGRALADNRGDVSHCESHDSVVGMTLSRGNAASKRTIVHTVRQMHVRVRVKKIMQNFRDSALDVHS